MQQHTFIVDKVKLGKKGQLTIPKKIRDEDGLQENDEFIVTHMPGGDITLQKKRKRSPEDMMLEAINSMPRINWRQAWKEVETERARERT